MIQVYIDESGNLGKRDNYFVLAAVVFRNEDSLIKAKRVMRRQKVRISKESNNEIEEMKSNRLSPEQRKIVLSKMTAVDGMEIFYLVAYKPQVSLLKSGYSKNLIYNYFAKLLTDMIFCKYNDDFNIIFDQRSTTVKSQNSLIEYITMNTFSIQGLIGKNISVKQKDSKSELGLQAADLFAGTIYNSYKRRDKHFISIIKSRSTQKTLFPASYFRNRDLKY